MAEQVAPSDRGGARVCAAGLALQAAVLVVLILVLVFAYDSQAIRAEALHQAAGAVIWLALLIVYRQRRRSQLEQLETEELGRTRAASGTEGIFDAQSEELLLQRRRLGWIHRWLLPSVTILLVVYHLLVFGGWYFSPRSAPTAIAIQALKGQATLLLFVVATVGFFCFLYSRYASGMARQAEWGLLRGGASYMTGNALACLAIVVALGFEVYGISRAEMVAAYFIRFLLLILGIEFLVNLILDFYRPRAAGEAPRTSFDSRLLALLSDPTGIARSLAEAINYQFGFEVSRTWFYRLLQRALLPLAIFTLLALFALSSVVVVDADQQAVIERWGRRMADDRPPLGPGLHFKLPWPVEQVHRASVEQIHEIVLGGKDEASHADENAPILWTEQHKFVPEMLLLLATPELAKVSSPLDAAAATGSRPQSKAVGVSLLMVSTHIAYRIKDLRDFLYNYQDPETAVESIAYEALTEYGAARDITGIMGPEREAVSKHLRARVQQEADALKLGIEITFLGLQDAHPPSDNDVAKTFQDVITSEQKKEAAIRMAMGKAEVMLTEAAGSVERANQLDEAIRQKDELERAAAVDVDAIQALGQRIDDLLLGDSAKGISPMSGMAAKQINEARTSAIRRLSEAEADARVFANQVVAFRAAPHVFKMRLYLDALQESVRKPRKFIVTGDRKRTDLILILDTAAESGALDLSSPTNAGGTTGQ